jgi:hypothetical protein
MGGATERKKQKADVAVDRWLRKTDECSGVRTHLHGHVTISAAHFADDSSPNIWLGRIFLR